MKTNKRYALALHVEGIVTQSNRANGVLFTFTDTDLQSNFEWDTWDHGYEVINAMVGAPTNVNNALDLDYNFAFGAATFSLTAHERLTKIFLKSRPYEIGQVTFGFTTSDIVIPISSLLKEDGTEFVIGDILYMGDETIKIQSKSSSNYTLKRGCGALQTTGAQNPLVQAPIQDHPAGRLIYDSPPYIGLRKATLLYFDLDDPNTFMDGTSSTTAWVHHVLWSGLISNVSTNPEQTEILITAQETIATLLDINAGGSYDLELNAEFKYLRSDIGNIFLQGSLPPQIFSDHLWANPDQVQKLFLIDDTIWAFDQNASGTRIPAGPLYNIYPNDREPGRVQTKKFREVIGLDRTQGSSNTSSYNTFRLTVTSGFGDVLGGVGVSLESGVTRDDAEFNSDGERGFQWHPVAIALALLVSRRYKMPDGSWNTDLNDPVDGNVTWRFDILSTDWGAGIDIKYIDWQSFINALYAEPNLFIEQMEHISTYNILETVLDLLSTANYFLTVNDEGKITLRKIQDFTLQTWLQGKIPIVSLYEDVIPMQVQMPQNKLVVEIGTNYKENGGTATVATIVGNRSDTTLGNTKGTPLNFNFYTNRRLLRSGFSFIEDKVAVLAYLKALAPPIMKITVPCGKFGYRTTTNLNPRIPTLGSWIALQGGPETGVIGPDGTRIPVDSTIFVGMILNQTFDVDGFTCTLHILLTNWAKGGSTPKLVCPSHRILSYDLGNNQISVSATELEADPQYKALWNNATDAYPYVRQESAYVTFWSHDGAPYWGSSNPLQGSYEVTNVTKSGSNYILTIPDFDPQTGYDSYDLFVRLKPYTVAPAFESMDLVNNPPDLNDLNALSRLFAYLADSTSKLGVNDDPADIWAGL